MSNFNSINNGGVPYYFPADIAKEGQQYARFSNWLKTRVNDSGKKVPVKWYDQGRVMNVNGLTPFIQGMVGHFTTDENDELMPSSDVVSRDWQGSPADVTDGGFAFYTLEDQFFCQEGQFKGVFGLRDNNGNTYTSVNIVFEILGNDLRIGETTKYYSSKLDKMVQEFNIRTDQAIKEARDAYNKQTQASHDATIEAQAAVDNLRETANKLSTTIGQQQNYIDANNIVTTKNFTDLSANLMKYVTESFVQPEAYDNLDILKKTYPTGAKGIFVTIDTGHFYVYENNDWKDCGAFQSSGIADGSVHIEKLNNSLQDGFYPDVTEVKIGHINTGYLSWFGKIITTKGDGTNGEPVYSDTIPVLPDEEYYIFSQNYWDGKVVNLLKQGKLVKYIPAENNAQKKFIKITIPHDVDGMILNGTRTFPPRAFKVNYYTQIPDSISSFVPILKNQDYNFEKVELTKKANYGYWDKNWGDFMEAPFDKTRAQIAYEPIKVKPFEIYKITGCSAWDARLWEIINSEGKIIDYCSTEVSNNLTETVMIPKNGAYLQINELFLDTHTFVEKAVSIKGNLPLSGKTWTAIGDSWTQIHADKHQSYVDYVGQTTGIVTINAGAGGTGYVTGGSNNWNNQFYKRQIDSKSNVVTVFGSFNDAYDSNFKFGKQGDTDTNTLWGALKSTLDHIYSLNFDAQVGIIAPGPWGAINQHLDPTIKMSTLGTHSDSEINEMSITAFAEKYVQTLQDFAKLNSLPFLDLYHYSGLRPWDSTFINKYYHGTNDTDTTHPNSEAMKKFIAPKIAEFIKTFA